MDAHDPRSQGGLAVGGEEVVLHFASGIPGFPDARQFAVRDLDPSLAPFVQMHSLESADLAFTLVPPGAFFPDYRVEIDDENAARLELRSAEDAVVLCIVTPVPPPGSPVVNLLGPLVVNRKTRAAAQVVQHRSGYGVAEPLTAWAGVEPAAGAAAEEA